MQQKQTLNTQQNIYLDLLNNSSLQSEQQDQQRLTHSQNNRPVNKTTIICQQLIFDSNFPSGNLHQVITKSAKQILYVEFTGNSDFHGENRDKCWFHFSIDGFEKTQHNFINLKWRNANSYRKFIRQKKYKPYILVREVNQQQQKQWHTKFIDKINILEDETLEAQFTIAIPPNTLKIYIAANLPYTMDNLQELHDQLTQSLDTRGKIVYYHREFTTYSFDQYPVYLCTITSVNNVADYSLHEQEIWPNKGIRPHKLKERPEIIITARVHPSQVSSSWFIQGLMKSLINNPEMQPLLQLFIFRIFPMINPDGVENGHYRLDNFLQNLNRFYGHSQIDKTPSIYVVEKLLQKSRQKGQLFMYFDIHGHNSPKPSFIYGNFSTNLFQSLENRTYCRILDQLGQGTFDYNYCQFSKKNMTIKEKYDQHSKQASGRVYAFRGDSQQQNLQTNLRNYYFVEHSYTYQVWPYIIPKKILRRSSKVPNSLSSRNIQPKSMPTLQRIQSVICIQPTLTEIKQCYYKQGENLLQSILQLLGLGNTIQVNQGQQIGNNRRAVYRELIKHPDYFIIDRNKKIIVREIDKNMIQKYCQKWKIIDTLHTYLNSTQAIKTKFQTTIIYGIIKQKRKTRKNMNLVINSQLKNSYRNQGNKNNQLQPKDKDQQQLQETQPTDFAFISISKKKQQEQVSPKKSNNFNKMRSIQFQDIGRQITTKNNTGNQQKNKNISSNKKKVINYTQTGEMSNKIRKLIFRHKTDNQIYDFKADDESHRKNRIQTQMQQKGLIVNKQHKNSKTQKKINYQLFNMKKTQKHTMNCNQFEDANMQFQTKSEKKKTEIPGKDHFGLYDIMRRISTKKQRQMQTINFDQDQYTTPTKIKSTHITGTKRQKNQRPATNLNQQKRTMSCVIEQFLPIRSSSLLPPVFIPPHEQPEFSHSLKPLGRNKFKGISKQKSKKKVDPALQTKQLHLNDIVNNFKVLGAASANRIQFLNKAKKMLQDRKNYHRVSQSPKKLTELPIISEIAQNFKN